MENDQLVKLALTNSSFSEGNVQMLCEYLSKNYRLRYLDISWNQIEPGNWVPLLKLLAEN